MSSTLSSAIRRWERQSDHDRTQTDGTLQYAASFEFTAPTIDAALVTPLSRVVDLELRVIRVYGQAPRQKGMSDFDVVDRAVFED